VPRGTIQNAIGGHTIFFLILRLFFKKKKIKIVGVAGHPQGQNGKEKKIDFCLGGGRTTPYRPRGWFGHPQAKWEWSATPMWPKRPTIFYFFKALKLKINK
jgi:hypothetical protein